MTNRLGTIVLCLLLVVGVYLVAKRYEGHAQPPDRFVPPSAKVRAAAIGDIQQLPAAIQSSFDPSDFQAIPEPGPSDWLANHLETGQTFDQYVRSFPNRPNQHENVIYLLPLGKFDGKDAPDPKLIQSFASCYFQMKVKVLDSVALEGLPIKSRQRRGQPDQLLTRDILSWSKHQLPDDAYCLLAITMQDLYPDEKWNFVFGQASLSERVGVYSFARYLPNFTGADSNDKERSRILLRSCKVLAHETGHMFGIKHCVHFHCLMNGSNHLEESDSQPLHVCPVCLRKLHEAIGLDLAKRYEQLGEFSSKANWNEDARWFQNRLKALK